MNTLQRYLVAGFLAVLAFTNPARGEPDQPRMRAALESLQSAKKAKDPLPDLNAARKELSRAKHNKAGEREEAVKQLDEAIKAAQAGSKEKMLQKIDHAISNIHSGMDKGRG